MRPCSFGLWPFGLLAGWLCQSAPQKVAKPTVAIRRADIGELEILLRDQWEATTGRPGYEPPRCSKASDHSASGCVRFPAMVSARRGFLNVVFRVHVFGFVQHHEALCTACATGGEMRRALRERDLALRPAGSSRVHKIGWPEKSYCVNRICTVVNSALGGLAQYSAD